MARAWVTAVAGLGLGLGLACGLAEGSNWPTIPFVCDPAGPENPPCPDRFACCSDDPATVDGVLLFADASNDRGRSGLCINRSDIPRDEPNAAPGCAQPCNPTWDDERVAEVCEPSRRCCQTRELVPEDCVFDEAEGRFRPMDGREAEAAARAGAARWGEGTHQDPEFAACQAYAGARDTEAFFACTRQLTVADQRGYCTALAPGQLCPAQEPDFVDACEAMNE